MDIRRKTGVNKVAYKGNIDFTKEKNRFTVNPRPRSNFITIGADYNLFRQPFAGVSSVSNPDVTVPFVGSAWFGQFRFPAPGLSTNIIKTSVMDCMNVALPEGVNPENARNYMFAFTPLFVNYDFRIGGSFLQYGDVNLLLSYSWYPELTRFLPMSHFSGHEAFGGLEVASRFKMLNLNVRAGLQYFNGDRHYFEPDGKKISKVADQFIPADHFEQMMFVVTAGISLGSRKANGRNVIRLF